MLNEERKRQLDLVNWINTVLSCPYDLPDRNMQFSHICFDLAIEHHAAICLLSESQLYGSMYSLLRVEFEALVKGLWLRHVAPDEDLVKFERNKLDLRFGDMIKLIESKLEITSGVLSEIKTNQWKIFNAFTHNGYQALVRRVSETHTGPVNYPDSEIVGALRHAGLFAIFSAVELSSLTGDQELIEKTMSIAKGYGA